MHAHFVLAHPESRSYNAHLARKSEWGPDGRIVPDAPAYSPYIRHRKHLDLE
jgi:hypothetical protein